MNETPQTPAPSQTDPSSCPECSKLLAFAELDEMIAAGVASPGQMTQHDELARELSGNAQNGERVAAVLARELAAARHRSGVRAMLEVKADKLIAQLKEQFGHERLEKNSRLAILPSGNAVSIRGIVSCYFFEDGGTVGFMDAKINLLPRSLYIDRGMDGYTVLTDPADVAAFRAALLNVGVAINAPTIAGEDRDGDGRTGE